MKKNYSLFLALFFSLISLSSFATSVKRVTEMDKRRFYGSIPIYYENKNSPDPKMKKLSEYAANLFAQYFALANKIGGIEMKAVLRVIYYDDKEPTPTELIQRGEEEARRQGIKLLNIDLIK